MNPNIFQKLADLFSESDSSTDYGVELHTNKLYLLKIHGAMADTLIEQKVKNMCAINLTVKLDQRPIPKVTVKLDPAFRVDIRHLMRNPDNTLVGKFFLCRTIAPPFQMSSILSVVDDPEGQRATRLALYNYPTKSKPLLQVLPVGTIMAIKNPWFKPTMDGGFALRVDNPTNVVIIDDALMETLFSELKWKGDIPEKYKHLVQKSQEKKKTKIPKSIPPTKTAIDFKDSGNKYFVAKQFEQALECYTKGLTLDPNNIEILSNRAAAYVNLEYFHRALEDTEKVLSIDPSHVKGNYRKVKSLWGLKRNDDAISFLKKIATAQKETVEFRELLSKYEKLNLFRTTGKYDWQNLFDNKVKQHIDFVDYCGPIEISPDIPGKGRGIVATKDISPGTLIIASKAFATYCSEVSFSIDDPAKLKLDLEKESDQLEKIVAEKLKIEPEYKNEVYALFAGPDTPPISEEMIGGEIDKKRIKNICAFNAFKGETITDLDNHRKVGLWILPSYINHSCWNSNCTWITSGEVIVVRSFKSISKGEEILISYVNPLEDFEFREIDLKFSYHFACECTLCLEDGKDSRKVKKRREKILSTIEMYAGSTLLKKILQLEALRSSATSLNNVIVPPLLELAHFYFSEQQLHAGIAALAKGYSVLKNTSLVDEPIEYLLNIIVAFIVLEANGGDTKEEVMKWAEILKKELVLRYGSLTVMKGHVGKKTFIITGTQYIDILGGYGLSFD